MCGIVGILYNYYSKAVSPPLLKKMCDLISHRGPDDEGFYINNHVGLGHRRLSIIDLNSGHQPIHNEDKSIWIVYNGEFYNFLENKSYLEEKGHKFYTKTDTEVIIHLYEEFGFESLKKINGMFAFAIWNDKKKELFIARDRLGKKPLFYYKDDEKFIFASEIKSILADETIEREVDLNSINDYLTYGYIPAPKSAFKNIYKLLPGNFLVLKENNLSIYEYWNIYYDESYQDEDFYIEEIKRLLIEAVKKRLISDVPLGAFLSGGIDSSAVVAIMSKLMDRPVKTFSIGFDIDKFNELPSARFTASTFKTDHKELIVKPDAISLLPKLTWYFDEPFADSSSIPTYYVSKLAREDVKVVLSGDGGDELFAGYTRYLEDKKDQIFLKFPNFVKEKIFKNIGEKLPKGFKGKEYLQYIGKSKERRYLSKIEYFTYEMKISGLEDSFKESLTNLDSFYYINNYLSKLKNKDFNTACLYLDLKSYLPNDILVKVDKTSMANALEARVPILDYELVEFVSKIPIEFKIKKGRGKYIFKKALLKILPKEIFNKPKQGFGIPINEWFRGELKEYSKEILLDNRFLKRGYFKANYIENFLNEHFSKQEDHGYRIWALIALELWHQTFIDNDTKQV